MRPSHGAHSPSLVPWAVWFMGFALIVGVAADPRMNAKLTTSMRASLGYVSATLAEVQAP
jgi:hypothetical protein